jgi:hypothetical protein
VLVVWQSYEYLHSKSGIGDWSVFPAVRIDSACLQENVALKRSGTAELETDPS